MTERATRSGSAAQSPAPRSHLTVALLPGDGIGPEVVDAAVQTLEAVTRDCDVHLTYDEMFVGGAAIDAHGTPLRTEDLQRCRSADAILLGAVGGPAWDTLPVERRPERALLKLRNELGLGINLRPVRWTLAGQSRSPLKHEVAEGSDIAFVRELTGGIYFGKPSYLHEGLDGKYAVDTASYTERQITVVLDFAFQLARSRQGRVTSVDKANVMNTSRLWREVAIEYGRQHPDVHLEHALVDSFAMSLIQDPRRYDVVVTENLFGDILTDLAGVIAGSLGLLPSASLRPNTENGDEPQRDRQRFGMYEPIHGSAPGIAGQGIANPVGCILSAALMLECSLGQPAAARIIREAVQSVLEDGGLTADLSAVAPLSTQEFADSVITYIKGKGGSRERRPISQGADRDLRHHVA